MLQLLVNALGFVNYTPRSSSAAAAAADQQQRYIDHVLHSMCLSDCGGGAREAGWKGGVDGGGRHDVGSVTWLPDKMKACKS